MHSYVRRSEADPGGSKSPAQRQRPAPDGPADPHGVLAELRAERLLDVNDRLECGDVHLVEDPPEAPADALAAHAEGFVDLGAVRTAQHHGRRPARSQLNPQVPRGHQTLG